jgi:high frequency lysogenization protein
VRTERDRIVALAGLFQAASLVESVARRGTADQDPVQASLRSLLETDPPSVEAVFGGLAGVAQGLRCLHAQLGGGPGRSLPITRYVLSLMQLERKAARSATLMEELRAGIAATLPRLEHFPPDHPNLIAGLADLYTRTIGTLQPRIMVHGEPLYLRNEDNVRLVRALLLAGIRAAVLWRQCGGNRLQILLRRGRMLAGCSELLREID